MAHILNVGHSVIFSKQAQLFSVVFLCTAIKEMSILRAAKYESFEKMEVPEEEISLLIKEDEESYAQWKSAVIKKLQLALPPRLNKVLIWDEVSKMFDESYKNK